MQSQLEKKSVTDRPHGRVFNFSPGPATLPSEVMERVHQEFMNYGGIGASVIEISHRSKQFVEIVDRATACFRELTSLPDDYSVLFMHGGGRMQFSAVPLNLVSRSASKRAAYVETDVFSTNAIKDAQPYGEIVTIASGRKSRFSRVPEITPDMVPADAAYLHITANNTVYGTRWNVFPEPGSVPLVLDCTSEVLSRTMDYSRFGIVYAGLQKNLGPSGTAIVVVRKDLLGHALPSTPPLLNYATVDKGNSLVNTPSTFNIYVALLVMEWIRKVGGVAAVEHNNDAKAQLLYDCIDQSGFYRPLADKSCRSTMNVTFDFPTPELLDLFLKDASREGLYALKGYREVGGVRASIYNGMPYEGVSSLVSFMEEFRRQRG